MKAAVKKALGPAIDWWDLQQLPGEAKRARAADHRRAAPEGAATHNEAIDAALDWLGAAQDNSATADGGVARHYSHVTGWAPSYPETTGYIVPTMIDQAKRRNRPELSDRARNMLDWLVSIQFPEGGFQGGMVTQTPKVPVTFNTGQILFGLAAGVQEFGETYQEPMRKAADWLANSLDADGCWRKHRTPFAEPDDKAYETHVSWAMLEAARVEPETDEDRGWSKAALRQVDWALTNQQDNGWLAQCCLSDKTRPLTHTLGYALRGIMEAWRFSKDEKYMAGGRKLASGLRQQLSVDGRLAGRFRADWKPGGDYVCLTGTVQIAHSWLMLYEDTGEAAWLDAARRANAYVRRTIALDAKETTRGGVRGSYPVDGEYGRFEYLNWAAKFFIDSHQLELDIAARGA